MSFDPETFLDATFSESNATTFEPIPPGEYPAVIDEIKFSNGVSKDGNPWSRIEVKWVLEDKALAERLGRKVLSSRQNIMLDFLESGGLDMGKGRNINLGRLREAVDLNRPGEAFSFRMLTGRRAKVKVEADEYQGVIRDKITAVARLS